MTWKCLWVTFLWNLAWMETGEEFFMHTYKYFNSSKYGFPNDMIYVLKLLVIVTYFYVNEPLW